MSTVTTINSRSYSAIQASEPLYPLDSKKNYLFDLSYLSLLGVKGDKAIEFLQGQLSCDLNQLTPQQAAQGAQCNLKGRILALMDVVDCYGVHLIVPADLLEATQNSLTKTAILSRVVLKPQTEYCVLGYYVQNPDDLQPIDTLSNSLLGQTVTESYCCYHLGDGFYIILLSLSDRESFVRPFSEKNQFLGSASWHVARLMKQHIEIYPESRGLFLPHRLGLQNTHYISFNKGCYKGQEIIARTHYRATIKHELKVFTIPSPGKLHSGQRIVRPEDGSEVGELIDYALLPNGECVVALSILKDYEGDVVFEG